MKGYHELGSAVGREAQAAGERVGVAAFGIVSSYDPNNMLAKVKIQPPPAEGQAAESGWLPILCAQIGNGWGVYSPPAIGDQVVVVFPGGDYQQGVIMGGVPNDEDKPPTVPSGEIWLKHTSGSFIKLTSDGKIASKGEWEHDGSLKVTGDITDQTTSNSVTVAQLRSKYNVHKHGVVAVGSPTTVTDNPAT